MKKNSATADVVNLLWTGGWDSTFQLLQLLLIHQRPVRPYYLIDIGRGSTLQEILTIQRLKNIILLKFPLTRKLLRPTCYFAVDDIAADAEITGAYELILKKTHIGSQYDWLARFCKENQISDMQLCIHPRSHDKGHFNIEQILDESTDGAQKIFRVGANFKNLNEYVLFQYFSFPILKINKLQMSALSDKEDWSEIMAMTWFCYNPTYFKMPCGRCNPCIQVIEDGLGWRIPLHNRIISYFYKRLIRPLKPRVKVILEKYGLLKFFKRGQI